MQGRCFDTLVQALADRSSRRGLIRGGLLSGIAAILPLLRGAGTAAHHSGTPLGGSCRLTSQCLNHAVTTRRRRSRKARQAVYCADNGFTYDGALNCCRYNGGACSFDEDCCGARYFCRNRVCTLLR